jgi:DNA polymerase III alpha subunit
MTLFEKLKKNINHSLMTPDLAEWTERELFWLECNEDDAKYLLDLKEKTAGKPIGNKRNSTVAYLMGITNSKPTGPIDSTAIQPPDLDYDTNGRDQLKAYFVKKYGIHNVALIATYGSMKTKGCVKDIIRITTKPLVSRETADKLLSSLGTLDRNLFQNDTAGEASYFKASLETDSFLATWLKENKEVNRDILDALKRSENVNRCADCVSEIIRRATMPFMSPDEANFLTKRFDLVKRNKFGLDLAGEVQYFHAGLEADAVLRNFFIANPEIKEGVLGLLGNTKARGIHAGGVIISSKDLRYIIPLEWDKEENMWVTQVEKDYAESIGLIKYDFLGLTNQEHLMTCKEMILKRHGVDIDTDNIAFEPAVFEDFRSGKTESIFQANTPTQTGMFTQLTVTPDLNDISMVTSIGRPGPLSQHMDIEYIERRNGISKVTYLHHLLEPILKDTYGIIVYQESVMRIMREIGGLTADESNDVRAAMGKKRQDKLEKYAVRFLNNASSLGMSKDVSKTIWDRCFAFSEYGFNKSHSISYAQFSYICMWFKHHYPLEWKCSVLSCKSLDSDDFKTYNRHWGADIKRPSVNGPVADYGVDDATGGILMPMSSVNGIAGKASEALQASQPFANEQDFFDRAPSRAVTKGVMLNLIFSGCVDVFKPKDIVTITDIQDGPSDDSVYLLLSNNLKIPVQITTRLTTESGEQISLSKAFKNKTPVVVEGDSSSYRRKLVERFIAHRHSKKKPPPKEREQDAIILSETFSMNRIDIMSRELELLNITTFDYFSFFGDLIISACNKKFGITAKRPSAVAKCKDKETVVIAGAIESVVFRVTKTGDNAGKEFAIIKVSSGGDSAEVMVFAKQLQEDDAGAGMVRKLKPYYPIAVKGRINNWNGKTSLIVDNNGLCPIV